MFINPRNIAIQGIYIKVTIFNIYTNFWDKVLRKTQILEIYIHICLFHKQRSQDFPSCLTPVPSLDHRPQTSLIEKKTSLIVFRHKFYQNLACGAHFQFNNHDLFEKFYWKWSSWYKVMSTKIISFPCKIK